MKIVIIGLPYFTNYLSKSLKAFAPQHQFIALDTYYKKEDKIKFFFHLFNADIVHSINGSLQQSGAFDWAIKLKKNLIFHWVGTDLTQAEKDFDQHQFVAQYLRYPHHLTDTPWYVQRLENMGVKAQFMPLKGFENNIKPKELPSQFSVLAYVSQSRAEFYGIQNIAAMAARLPQITFNMVGIESYKNPLPANVVLKGWVENMTDFIHNSVVCLRLPETDGLSFFVLEALSNGRYVAYNQNFELSQKCNSVDEFVQFIQSKYDLFAQGKLQADNETAKKVNALFAQSIVMQQMIAFYQNLSKSK